MSVQYSWLHVLASNYIPILEGPYVTIDLLVSKDEWRGVLTIIDSDTKQLKKFTDH